MTDVWRLDTLPTDVLILIFDYCHACDLVRLRQVCRRFYDIVRDDTLWIKKSKQPLVTNQTSPKFRDRCYTLLNLRKRWHVSYNWQFGRYERKMYDISRTKVMPWIQLTNDKLWWGGGNRLCGFSRDYTRRECIFSERHMSSDVCKFIVKDKIIISGHRDGSLRFWRTTPPFRDHHMFSIERAHSCDVSAVDEVSGTLVSGSRDGTVKIWMENSARMDGPTATIDVGDRVWSLAIDPEGLKVAVGSSGNAPGQPPLHLFDLECYSQSDVPKYKWRRGAGLLDMVWDDPHTLLTCGYDTYVRKWDLRTGKCVGAWPDPTDASVYCIATDHHYTMLTGTQFHGKAVLWDQRQKNYVQFYFMHRQRVSSPVYSIRFDSSQLFGATDRHLANLTFSGYSYEEINYSNF